MLTNTATRYGAVARGLHWAMALLVIAALALGLIGKVTPRNADTVDWLQVLYSLHKTIGVTVLALAVLRILWALSQPRPAPLHPERRLETLAAEAAHWLLYGAILVLPLSGWVMHAAEDGFAPIWWPFGQTLPFVPKSDTIAGIAGGVHFLAAIALVATLAAHIGGALKHALIDRDATLARMWRGAEAGGPEAAGGHRRTAWAALAIWAAVIALPFASAGRQQAGAGVAPGQAEAAGWQVQTGTLGFEVIQMGATVEGRFDSWEAAIDYDPQTGTGEVAVTIDMTSVALGSVTDQAKGPEFFDVARHAQAVFAARIARIDGAAHQATGSLTLVGRTVPVVLAFDLDLADGTATAAGRVTLDRRDFGIGAAYPDDSNVGFAVPVEITLTATPQE
ncbi:MAG: Cytochrome B561 [Rhodobacteraceae bacterium HLUCCA08]|nr:MAG: Cytochrome B561 [Rhodobacteraceae bacterium HLUCCA08]